MRFKPTAIPRDARTLSSRASQRTKAQPKIKRCEMIFKYSTVASAGKANRKKAIPEKTTKPLKSKVGINLKCHVKKAITPAAIAVKAKIILREGKNKLPSPASKNNREMKSGIFDCKPSISTSTIRLG